MLAYHVSVVALQAHHEFVVLTVDGVAGTGTEVLRAVTDRSGLGPMGSSEMHIQNKNPGATDSGDGMPGMLTCALSEQSGGRWSTGEPWADRAGQEGWSGYVDLVPEG